MLRLRGRSYATSACATGSRARASAPEKRLSSPFEILRSLLPLPWARLPNVWSTLPVGLYLPSELTERYAQDTENDLLQLDPSL